jgi:hypothetical protein
MTNANLCATCGATAEMFGYRKTGQMVWYCAEHRPVEHYADASLPAPPPPNPLAEHAKAIKAAGTRAINDIIEIGRHLTEAKKLCGHGNWLPWLKREFGWTGRTALSFMHVYEMGSKTKSVSDLNLPLSGLYLLAAPSTPEAARQEIFDQARSGKKITVGDVKDTVAKSRYVAVKVVTSSRVVEAPVYVAPAKPPEEQEEFDRKKYDRMKKAWEARRAKPAPAAPTQDDIIAQIVDLFKMLDRQTQNRCMLRLRAITTGAA